MTGTTPVLRDYQTECLEKLKASLMGHNRSILCLPTGAGKTVVAAEMIRRFIARDPKRKAFFLVHRRELVRQASETLKECGIAVGHIAAGWPRAPWRQVQVCSIQTLARNLNIRIEPHLIVMDEAHHCASKTWSQVFVRWPKAYVVGLTATPERLDGKGLGHLFGDLVMGASMQELMAQGHLATPDVFSIPSALVNTFRKRMGDFDKKELGRAADGPQIIAESVNAYARYGKRQPALFFGVNVEHATKTAEQFRKKGFIAEAVDGKTDKGKRDWLFDLLHKGRIDVICSCEIVSEGFDCPNVGCILMARPTLSMAMYRQQAGRGMRPGEHKTLLDLCGNVHRHGLPWDDYPWDLGGRDSATAPVDTSLTLWTCEGCYAVNPCTIRKCRNCGQVREVRKRRMNVTEKAVKLQAIDGSFSKAKPQLKKPMSNNKKAIRKAIILRAQKKARGETFEREDLEEIRKEYNFKPGWTAHMYEIVNNYGRRDKEAKQDGEATSDGASAGSGPLHSEAMAEQHRDGCV